MLWETKNLLLGGQESLCRQGGGSKGNPRGENSKRRFGKARLVSLSNGYHRSGGKKTGQLGWGTGSGEGWGQRTRRQRGALCA